VHGSAGALEEIGSERAAQNGQIEGPQTGHTCPMHKDQRFDAWRTPPTRNSRTKIRTPSCVLTRKSSRATVTAAASAEWAVTKTAMAAANPAMRLVCMMPPDVQVPVLQAIASSRGRQSTQKQRWPKLDSPPTLYLSGCAVSMAHQARRRFALFALQSYQALRATSRRSECHVPML